MGEVALSTDLGIIFVETSLDDYYRIIQCLNRCNEHKRKVRERWRTDHNSKSYSSHKHTLVINVLTPQGQVTPSTYPHVPIKELPLSSGLRVVNREIPQQTLDKFMTKEPLYVMV